MQAWGPNRLLSASCLRATSPCSIDATPVGRSASRCYFLSSLGRVPARTKAPPQSARTSNALVHGPGLCRCAVMRGMSSTRKKRKRIVPKRAAANRALFPKMIAAPAASKTAPVTEAQRGRPGNHGGPSPTAKIRGFALVEGRSAGKNPGASTHCQRHKPAGPFISVVRMQDDPGDMKEHHKKKKHHAQHGCCRSRE